MCRECKFAVTVEDVYNLPKTVVIPKGTTVEAAQVMGVSDHYDLRDADGTEIHYVSEKFLSWDLSLREPSQRKQWESGALRMYKAKRSSDGKWIQSGSILRFGASDEHTREVYMPAVDETCNFIYNNTDGYIKTIDKARIYRVNPDTVSMCSSVKDSNGTAIWEGDIVSVQNTYNGPDAPKQWYVVRWWDEAAALTYTDNFGYMYNHLNGWNEHCIIRVEGNAWDNPELLNRIRDERPEEYDERVMKALLGHLNVRNDE